MKLKIHSLTSDLWPALEELFGKLGACNGCWCMYWRICPAYRKQDREVNKAAFRQIVGHGPPPGLIAFDGEVPVGWCQLTPRNALPWLDRVWRLSALIAAAVTIAKMAGASALEAYPLDGDLTSSASRTGYASTFARAGFNVLARHTPLRPIVRLDLGRKTGPLTS
jgi:hypothetical protein